MSKRILVVEDDLLNRMFLCATLEAEGFVVQQVSDGAHALNSARRFRPDLITMDINLPTVSGLELITQLKRDSSLGRIPVLAITAFAGKIEESRIREVGAEDYLAKPITVGQFLFAVRRLLPA